ncbi:MAG: hypothetical protein J6E46_07790 [Faecalicoccus sp.]|nr:hypothetical protein [Faecalicoccus sp.]
MKKFISMIICMGLLLSLSACSSGILEDEATISQTSWSWEKNEKTGGVVNYGFVLENNTSNQALMEPEITIIATDAKGTVIDQSDYKLSYLEAGDIMYYGISTSLSSKPTNVEFQISGGEYIDSKYDVSSKIFSIADITEVKTKSDYASVKGKITNISDGNVTPIISSVYKNGSDIVAIYTTYMFKGIDSGQTQDFQIYTNSTRIPEYDSVEVYANYWI